MDTLVLQDGVMLVCKKCQINLFSCECNKDEGKKQISSKCVNHKDQNADRECENCNKKFCTNCVRLCGWESDEIGETILCLICTESYFLSNCFVIISKL
jgi:hypothetical protein